MPALIILGFGITLSVVSFYEVKTDITSLTNPAFAILAGITAICFSWARVVDKDDIRKDIRNLGERSLLAATTFLFASALKYIAVGLDLFPLPFVQLNLILHIYSCVLIAFALLLSFGVINVLNRVLWKKYLPATPPKSLLEEFIDKRIENLKKK